MKEKVRVVTYFLNLNKIGNNFVEVPSFRCIYKPKISLDASTPRAVIELFNESKKFGDKLISLKDLVANAKTLNCLIAASTEYQTNSYQCGVLFLGVDKDNNPTLDLKDMSQKYIFGPIQRYA